jgi:hypothetical protein
VDSRTTRQNGLGETPLIQGRKQTAMTTHIPFDFSTIRWELWSVPVAGVICTGLVLMGGRWLMGRRQPETPQTQDPLNPYQSVATPKRRQTPRGRGAPTRILILDKNGPKEPFSGYVINRSIGGLCVSLVQPLEEGSVVSVRPAKEAFDDTWYEVEVKYCRATDTGWEMGCEFLSRASSNTMLKFS